MKDITLKPTAFSKALDKLKDRVVIALAVVFMAFIVLGAVDASVNDKTDMRNTKIEFKS
ncbi:hypothetical protein [Pseudomonas sp. NBRC 111118]|uniref:hypothetical protein n=1 Tax=Pseudomonas sp. NBRC 111118 TaxID=1661033 RepID=UPI000ACF8BB3|nr:hypothetical protein [Pseudomonas sp. NBRC 111118]